MNYTEAIDFLFSSLPMYQREGKAAYKANLNNTRRLDLHFGKPHRHYSIIHVAGTNGKGSVSHMLASVFMQAGYKTGLYTSPHLLDFRERIKINGKAIPEEDVCNFVSANQEIIQKLTPSFFEMTVAMAFEYFATEDVDIAIIETGMGGRLDSTNIVRPLLTIITNISMDHSQFLGDTPRAIAREKGGIIKGGVPLVLGQSSQETEDVLMEMAEEKAAPVTRARLSFQPQFQTLNPDGSANFMLKNQTTGDVLKYSCDLSGSYQQENISTALTALSLLRKMGWELSDSHIEEGLKLVYSNTGLMGRWQSIGANPRSVCDAAHNHAGISAVMEQIRQTPRKKLHMVWGMVNDKDLNSILPLLPQDAIYYFTPSSVPRTLDAEKLCRRAGRFGLKGEAYTSVEEAYHAALEKADEEDMIFTGGSTFVVADLLEALGY